MALSISKLRDWYARYERPISSAALVGGFIFNAITLKRVDFFWENFWVVLHLCVVAACIILLNRKENEAKDPHDTGEAHFWYVTILQFAFGGLLSTFLVFYFRSATLSVTWPFLILLAGAFVANESLKKHYERLALQISFFFLSLYSFAIFIVPVFFHRIGAKIFLASGLASLLILSVFLYALQSISKEKFKKNRQILLLSVSGIFITINALYFFHLIPPIPLSLKDGGIYHDVAKNADGNYAVVSETKSWSAQFAEYIFGQNFHIVASDSAYAYSAIFSPTSFSTEIIHEWQRYDDRAKKWVTVSVIPLATSGGRQGGYRTYSKKADVTAGLWRVNVETADGQIIGRLRFDIVGVPVPVSLQNAIKE